MFQPYTSGVLPLGCLWRGASNGLTWEPRLDVSIAYRGFESNRIRALVDSGSVITIFDSSVGERLGIPIRSGPSERLQGFSRTDDTLVYFHEVLMLVAGTSVRTKIGFCFGLPVTALLGRHGFFEHFRVTFDPARMGMRIDRVETE